MKFSRQWAMPCEDTFSIRCIGNFVKYYMDGRCVSVDPFSRNKMWATHTNDINPNTAARHHMDAIAYLGMLNDQNVVADIVILDPPYSPRQISECYKSIGITPSMKDTQTGKFCKHLRDATIPILKVGGLILSFGWNSVGMGRNRGFEILEIMIVCHGGAHNDTICMAEKLTQSQLGI